MDQPKGGESVGERREGGSEEVEDMALQTEYMDKRNIS